MASYTRARENPFTESYSVPVEGGALSVARAGASIDHAVGVVLAVHGLTGSHLAWGAVARELIEETGACVLAPDLRGRGASSKLPGPYGIAAHVADLVALLDHLAAGPVVLVGHSMGAYVGARLAAEHPERVSKLVLVDGGFPIPLPADEDPDEVLAKTLGPALERLGVTFPTLDDYAAMWRRHPALTAAWNSDLQAFVEYDVGPADGDATPDAVRSLVSPDAVTADSREVMVDEETRTAIERVGVPLWLLRAPRGLMDEVDRPLIPGEMFEEFAAAHNEAHAETVEDTNHYTLLLGRGPGPARVAAVLREALEGER